jgi:hypothetical protein
MSADIAAANTACERLAGTSMCGLPDTFPTPDTNLHPIFFSEVTNLIIERQNNGSLPVLTNLINDHTTI